MKIYAFNYILPKYQKPSKTALYHSFSASLSDVNIIEVTNGNFENDKMKCKMTKFDRID